MEQSSKRPRMRRSVSACPLEYRSPIAALPLRGHFVRRFRSSPTYRQTGSWQTHESTRYICERCIASIATSQRDTPGAPRRFPPSAHAPERKTTEIRESGQLQSGVEAPLEKLGLHTPPVACTLYQKHSAVLSSC